MPVNPARQSYLTSYRLSPVSKSFNFSIIELTMQKTEHSLFFMQVQASLVNQKLPQTQIKQVLAHALVEKLQSWCMQLLWMTLFCVISCCGEEHEKKCTKQIQNPKRRIEDIEQKMLRNLTSPMISGTLRPVRRTMRRRVLSRPPSPQLFDIEEE